MSEAATAPAKKVAAKSKKPAAHPPYAEMIAKAIVGLADKRGSSKVAIKKYILANFKVEDSKTTNTQLNLALKRGVAGGKLATAKGHAGSFKPTKEEKAKKPNMEKSPTKITTAKKPTAEKITKKSTTTKITVDTGKHIAKRPPAKRSSKKEVDIKTKPTKSQAKKIVKPEADVDKGPAVAKKTLKKTVKPKAAVAKKPAAPKKTPKKIAIKPGAKKAAPKKK